MDILNGLYVLRNSDSIFVRRAEQMLSVGLPIKMWQFRLSEEELDAYVFENFPFEMYVVLNLSISIQASTKVCHKW